MSVSSFREKKREREREELWKRLHELADEIHTQKGDKPVSGGAGQQSNSDHTSSSNQNNLAQQSHSGPPGGISTQMNSMSISGTAAMSK